MLAQRHPARVSAACPISATRTYLDALAATTAPALYADATEALIRWQRATREDELPAYDEALLARELDLFPGLVCRAASRRRPDARSRRPRSKPRSAPILDNNLAQPRVFVHRDYHARNLMVAEPNPGVLDFQDAVCGPVTYDLVSLLRDAYIAWDEELQIDWAVRYWERARKAGLPVGEDFGDILS